MFDNPRSQAQLIFVASCTVPCGTRIFRPLLNAEDPAVSRFMISKRFRAIAPQIAASRQKAGTYTDRGG